MPLATTKRRTSPYGGIVGGISVQEDYLSVSPFYRKTVSKGPLATDSGWRNLNGTQTTVSENHPSWRDKRNQTHGRLFKGDVGGDFVMTRRYAVGMTSTATLVGTSGPINSRPVSVYTYTGPLLPIPPSDMVWPSQANSTDNQLNNLGTVAIARCSPSNPTANVTVFLGELLTEGIPKATFQILKGLASMTHRQRRRALGGDYLNVQFGWVPFLSDLRSIANAVLHADKVLRDYERGSGKLTRRRYEFPSSRKVVSILDYPSRTPWGPGAGALYLSPSVFGKVYRTEELLQKQWFSGAFTWYVPPPDSLRNDMARQCILARKLLGILPTPDAVWNLAPWSWMIDWFITSGDVLANWTDWAIDNQVLYYGYVMEHTVHSHTYTYAGPTGFKSVGPRPFDVKLVVETKIRRKATPYGFGFNMKGLTARQLAILAALGLNKS
ncbi:TPA_asm: maturation protein [ssRNA phage Zoerhiza.4_2]|jgi:hypothetical protein|uniref:Maturation protein n=2 Tax=Leviviricetes TaxID=2842243 RepID=A0A8S5KXE3_9VIRU|nr:maturation protein [ssRNA phage Zoerhiza.4_2]QDH87466.1 MAG: hypothetical protein H4Rhizo43279_000001 [Leviviridae sp.]DAD50318.1 TPA_asm: maturation protein [ssRNA phage Zoerhiza.4_2]